MYIWKCWRDNRSRFVILLLVIAGLIALGTKGTWHVSSNTNATKEFLFMWALVLAGSRFFIPFFALGFGASGVGEELSDNTAEFLLTRPRSRRYFVWTSWATGAAQTLGIDCLYLLTALAILLYRTNTNFSWEILGSIVPLLILGALIYSMTYLLTTVLRSARNGYLACVGIVLIYPMLEKYLHSQWNISIPSPSDLFLYSATGDGGSFQLVAAITWTLFAVACPLMAQWYVERIDV